VIRFDDLDWRAGPQTDTEGLAADARTDDEAVRAAALLRRARVLLGIWHGKAQDCPDFGECLATAIWAAAGYRGEGYVDYKRALEVCRPFDAPGRRPATNVAAVLRVLDVAIGRLERGEA
jgi:hypothetical protein